ncbi:PXDN protein, partial [Acromyrmex heyeri]
SFSVQLLNTQSANFFRVTDTLSLGDRTIDNMDRHAIQTRPRQQMLDHSSGPKSKPEPTFDFTQNSNVTALIGKTAYLTCRVRNLGDKTVSWVRHRDIHILTAGAYTYTSDQRFQALHRQNTGHGNEWSDWTLCIKWAQERDQGIYECQISTIPIKSYQFHLNVVVPTATILGGPELYVGAGSTINLTCAIRFSSEPPAYIFWYYNENVLSYDSPRGGVSVITEKGGDVTTSWLLIQTAQPSDSGEYSCKPSNANTASIRVHVLNVRLYVPPFQQEPSKNPCEISYIAVRNADGGQTNGEIDESFAWARNLENLRGPENSADITGGGDVRKLYFDSFYEVTDIR